MREFLNNIFQFSDRFKAIKIGHSDRLKIENAALSILKVKDLNQLRDKYEGALFLKRFSRQLYAEIAVEKYLSIKFIDWSLKSKQHHQSFIKSDDLNIGISVLDFGDYPVLIDKNLTNPQIFTILKGGDTILICGFASSKVLVEHQKDANLTSSLMGDKVEFTGFNQLLQFQSYDELKQLYSDS